MKKNMKEMIVIEDDEIQELIYVLTLFLESKELDKYTDGYKTYGKVEQWIKELKMLGK